MSVEPQVAPAAPTFTDVDVDPGYDAVIVTVAVPATATTLWVWRTGPSGIVAYVRGAQEATVTPSSSVVVSDYEAPLGVTLTYHAQVANAAGELSPATTTTVTVPSSATDDPWLVDIAYVANTQRVMVESLPELKHAIDAAVHWVIARRAPIVTSDVARTAEFELTFVVADDDAAVRARNTLGNGIPCLLRTPPEQGVGNLYLSVIEFSERRAGRLALHPDRRFVVSAVQVQRPDPLVYLPVGVPNTYLEVEQSYATYALLEADNATYEELQYKRPSGAEPPPATPMPWPPEDV